MLIIDPGQDPALQRKMRLGALGLCVALMALYLRAISPWIFDDAFITLRYSENWAHGLGPVFNPGERVEGYTNFLWMALLALGRWAGLGTLGLAVALGLMFNVASLALVMHADRFSRVFNFQSSLMACLLLGTSGVFLAWGRSAMEVPMLGFLIVLFILLHMAYRTKKLRRGRLWMMSAVGLAMALTRPEGVMVFGLVALAWLAGRRGERRAVLAHLWLPFVVLGAAYYIWRTAYYGYPLPNTFYVKVGGSGSQWLSGLKYAGLFSLANPWLVLPLAGSFVLAAAGWRFPAIRVPVWVAIVYVAYVVAVGGDHAPAFRFLAPIVPLLSLIAGAVWERLVPRCWLACLVGLFVVTGLVQLRVNPYYYGRIQFDRVVRYGQQAGLWLREMAAPEAVVATNTAGSIPYYSGLRAIDMLGLNDVHIAHEGVYDPTIPWAGHHRGDGEYVLSLCPDFIILGSSHGSMTPVFPSDKAIYFHPDFRANYERNDFQFEDGVPFYVYIRKDGRLRRPLE